MNLKISTLAGVAGALSLLAGAAQASTALDANLAAPGVYFGAGNSNGHFAIETVDGVELGLRARQGPPHAMDAVSPVGKLYQVALGENISFDFSFNPGADGSPVSLDGLNTLITITNLAGGGSASFAAHLVPDNAHSLGAPGGFQNSERLSFGIFNGGGLGDIDYNNLVNSTYRIDFSASGTNFAKISDTIFVNQGAGRAVPEPSTWALTIAGFGFAGAALRRRRALTAI